MTELEVNFYRGWCLIFSLLLLLMCCMCSFWENRWEQDEKKLHSPEYLNCQKALIQCNNVNALKGSSK
jgi:hypothetical protein